MEVRPPEDLLKKRDRTVLKMLLEAIDLLGGPKKLAEYRNLTWIPSLIKASYAVILQDGGKTAEEIARELGLTKATVQKMLRSDEQDVLRRISGEFGEERFDDHIAGGIAKLAYKRLKEKEITEEIESVSRTAEILGADWAVHVMTKIKGLDFPVDKETLNERLSGLMIKGIRVEELLEELEYPVHSPSELLHKLSVRLKEKTG